jgi:hypothetical protein
MTGQIINNVPIYYELTGSSMLTSKMRCSSEKEWEWNVWDWIEIGISQRGKTFGTLSLTENITWLKQTLLEKEECDCGELNADISKFFQKYVRPLRKDLQRVVIRILFKRNIPRRYEILACENIVRVYPLLSSCSQCWCSTICEPILSKQSVNYAQITAPLNLEKLQPLQGSPPNTPSPTVP